MAQNIIYNFFFLFRAAPAAYGGSQTRSRIRATVAGLHQSHSNPAPSHACDLHHRSWPRSLSHWARPGIEPTTSGFPVGFVSEAPQELLYYLQIFEEELKVFYAPLWLNYYYFVLFDRFSLLLHFLTSPIKFILWLKFFYTDKTQVEEKAGVWAGLGGYISRKTPQGPAPRGLRKKCCWGGLGKGFCWTFFPISFAARLPQPPKWGFNQTKPREVKHREWISLEQQQWEWRSEWCDPQYLPPMDAVGGGPLWKFPSLFGSSLKSRKLSPSWRFFFFKGHMCGI